MHAIRNSVAALAAVAAFLVGTAQAQDFDVQLLGHTGTTLPGVFTLTDFDTATGTVTHGAASLEIDGTTVTGNWLAIDFGTLRLWLSSAKGTNEIVTTFGYEFNQFILGQAGIRGTGALPAGRYYFSGTAAAAATPAPAASGS